jgi:hypothetical protein
LCPGKVDRICNSLANGNLVVASNFSHIDELSDPIKFQTMAQLKSCDSNDNLSNIIKLFLGGMQYFGSAMGFRRELLLLILPFPKLVEAHDHFIALAANMSRSMDHIEERLSQRRIHGNNLSLQRRDLRQKIRTRLLLSYQIIILFVRMRKFRKKS